MKKWIISLLIFISFYVQALFATDVIRITNGEWAPYLSNKLPNKGFASHIVREAFAAVEIEVKYGFFPWKRSYKLAKEGTWNGTVVWVYTPKRARYFHYSDTIVSDNEYLFHLKETTLNWNIIEDLRGIKIGGTLHTVYPAFSEAEKYGIIYIERTGTYANLFRRLLKKRIDAIPQVKHVGLHLIRTTLTPEDQKKVTFSDTIIQNRNYHLILSKALPENKEYLAKFNIGLSKIRASGRYLNLLSSLKKGAYDSIQ